MVEWQVIIIIIIIMVNGDWGKLIKTLQQRLKYNILCALCNNNNSHSAQKISQ